MRGPMKKQQDDRKPAPSAARDSGDRLRIAFLMRFADLDLHELREGDQLNLTADLQSLLGWANLSARQFSLEEVSTVQARVREELSKVADANAFNAGIRRFDDRPFESILIDPALLENLTLSVLPNEGFRVEGELRPALLFTLYDALGRIDARRIRRCPEKTCQRLFFAEHKNSFFCSARCANRDSWKRFSNAKKRSKRRTKIRTVRRLRSKAPVRKKRG